MIFEKSSYFILFPDYQFSVFELFYRHRFFACFFGDSIVKGIENTQYL